MKTVKAFVNEEITKLIIKMLGKASIKNIMVEKVDEIADWEDQNALLYSLKYFEKYNHFEKIEFLCDDDRVNAIIEVIQEYSRTGKYDEGLILVQPVDQIVRIHSSNCNAFSKREWIPIEKHKRKNKNEN